MLVVKNSKNKKTTIKIMRKAFVVLRIKKTLAVLFEKNFIAAINKPQKTRLKTSIEAWISSVNKTTLQKKTK